MLKNPKTTIAGYLLLAASIIYGVAKFLQTGSVDGETVKAIMGALGGTGLIASADGGH